MVKSISTLLAVALASMSATALAQDDPFVDDSGPPAGADENPGAPDALTTDSSTMEEVNPKPVAKVEDDQGEYPQRFNDRPIILYQGMAEVRLEAPITTDDPVAGISFGLLGRFAVTREIEVGLRWSPVAFHESLATGGLDNSNTAGKAIQLDFVYQIFGWLGAQAAVPFYLDPFALGLTLGAPMQVEVGPLQFFGGRDLLQFNLIEFFPLWDDPVVNEFQAFASESVNNVTSDGRVNLLFGIGYQASDALVVRAESGVVFEDFKNSDNAVPMWLGAIYSPKRWFDIGLRTGFARIDDAGDSFGFRLLAALRI